MRTILVGCSLGEAWQCYFTYSSSGGPISVHTESYVYGGGSNNHGIHGLLNSYLTNDCDLAGTNIIVQYTGIDRKGFVMNDTEAEGLVIQNAITGKLETAVSDVPANEYIIGQNTMNQITDHFSSDYLVRDLTAILCMLSRLGCHVYAFIGWEGAMKSDYWSKTKQILRSSGVTCTDLVYMNTAIEFSKSDDEWYDEFHPSTDLACKSMNKLWLDMQSQNNNLE